MFAVYIPPRPTVLPETDDWVLSKPPFPAGKHALLSSIMLKFFVPKSRGCGSKAVESGFHVFIACWQVTEDEEENTVSMSFDDSSSEAEGLIKITSPSDPRVVLFFRQVSEDFDDFQLEKDKLKIEKLKENVNLNLRRN